VPSRCVSIHILWLLHVKLYLGQVIPCYTLFSEIPKWCAAISQQHNTLYTLGRYLFVDIRIYSNANIFSGNKLTYTEKCPFLLLYRGADKSLA